MADKKPTKKVEAVVDLAEELKTLQADLVAAKLSNATGELANPIVIRDYRRKIARLKTAMNIEAKENK